jgi:SAM-dependent methyltransferase
MGRTSFVQSSTGRVWPSSSSRCTARDRSVNELGDAGVRSFFVCPRDRSALRWRADATVCARGHPYPVVHGVPVLLGDLDPTGFGTETIRGVRERRFDAQPPPLPGRVDRVVEEAIAGTNGSLYRHLTGRLPRYPIPEIRLPPGRGGLLLDVGGGWGRWSIAAARAGYRTILVDPQLKLVLAAVRVARYLDVEVTAVCGDATALPFDDDAFDVAFSYSVLQHFGKPVARAALGEMRRVVRREGTVLVQLANRWGGRQLMNQLFQALGTRDTGPFRVRYWSLDEMRTTFEAHLGPSEVEVDGFFSLNVQPADLDLMPGRYRLLIRTSEWLRRASEAAPALRHVADSLYVRSSVGKRSDRLPPAAA